MYNFRSGPVSSRFCPKRFLRGGFPPGLPVNKFPSLSPLLTVIQALVGGVGHGIGLRIDPG
jgi:hypothetical protein